LALTTRTNSAVPPPPAVGVALRDADRVAVVALVAVVAVVTVREELADVDDDVRAVAVTVTVVVGGDTAAGDDRRDDAAEPAGVSLEQATSDATRAAAVRIASAEGVPDMGRTLRRAPP
jgi:hypothetical protein